jgi:hypothetical protein
MAENRRLLVELAHDLLVMIGKLPDGLAREDVGVGVAFGNCSGIVRPAGRQRRKAGRLKMNGKWFYGRSRNCVSALVVCAGCSSISQWPAFFTTTTVTFDATSRVRGTCELRNRIRSRRDVA